MDFDMASGERKTRNYFLYVTIGITPEIEHCFARA